MRTLVIGDVHGNSIAFDVILRAIDPKPEDLLIALGDYIDGGPDSRGVMERLISLDTKTRLVPLRGNHEEMLLRAWEFPLEVDLWLKVGGRETLDSYPDRRFAESHYAFLRDRCVDYFESETHIFAHGGVDPELPMARQLIPVLRWKTFREPKPHVSGKILICGHTPQREELPKDLGHSVCIDTGAGGTGWLTCLDVGTGGFIQSNEMGGIRRGSLAQCRAQPFLPRPVEPPV
jgi:serine/threonine protein phosphatase 1